MKAYGGVDVWLHALLTSSPDTAEWSASVHGGFTSGEDRSFPLNNKQGGHQKKEPTSGRKD